MTFAIATLFEEVGTARLLGRFDVPAPIWSSIDAFALGVAGVAFIGLWRLGWKVLPVIAASAFAGLVWYGPSGTSLAPAGPDVQPHVVDQGLGHPPAPRGRTALRSSSGIPST